MLKILDFLETPIGLVMLGAVLPLIPNFLKEIGKMLIDFIKWIETQICKLSKFIYQQICENLKEINFRLFAGNDLRNGSVLFVIKSSELKYFKKVEGFDTVWYVYKSGLQKDPHDNENTEKIEEAVKFVFISLNKKQKRRLYKIYKARKQFAELPIQGRLDYCEDLE